MSRPLCFMVMPFGVKATGLGPSDDGPTTVDFDALWEKVFAPIIDGQGYTPVRADQDAGALIIVEMIQRLAMSDLVVADISIPNANVYYEIGVRHAAQQYGCVLVAAHWARTLFDIDQMPRLTYTLNDGSVGDAAAVSARADIDTHLAEMGGGESPVYQAVPGFPDSARDDLRVSQFRADAIALNDLLGRLRAVRRIPNRDERKRAALELRDELQAQEALSDGVQLEVMFLLRDHAGMPEMLAWTDRFPDRLRTRPAVEEQRLLAISKAGDPEAAIGALEQLIASSGDSSERQGLLGGRYKKLYDAADDPIDRETYLDRAIEHYELGMMLDLNDYYPSSNLPRLYRERNEPGDSENARLSAGIALKGCERARALDPDDEWIRPTLLGAAFDAQDPRRATELAREVRRGRPADWQLATTIYDLRMSARQATDPAAFAALADTFNRLNELLADDDRLEPLDPGQEPPR